MLRDRLLWLAAAALLVFLIGACTRPASPYRDVGTSPKPVAATLRFGPVYPVRRISDPLVARTLKGARTTSAAATGAEIRGYLVDWVIRQNQSEAIREFAVMKDGTRYALPDTWRPAAALRDNPPPRLTPEPLEEARSREAAVASARIAVARADADFGAQEGLVYNYLVRIHRADGSFTDVWVDPDVAPDRFFYDIQLIKDN